MQGGQVKTVHGPVAVDVSAGADGDVLAVRAGYYLEAKVKGAAEIAALMFSDKHDIFVKTAGVDELINTIKDEYNG